MAGKQFSLKFTGKAEQDLNEIYEYIANNLEAMDAAEKLMGKIETGILMLKDFPYSCSMVLDEVLKSKGYRKLIIDNYIAFYLVDEHNQQVVIMRILYGASQYDTIL